MQRTLIRHKSKAFFQRIERNLFQRLIIVDFLIWPWTITQVGLSPNIQYLFLQNRARNDDPHPFCFKVPPFSFSLSLSPRSVPKPTCLIHSEASTSSVPEFSTQYEHVLDMNDRDDVYTHPRTWLLVHINL